MHYQHGLLLSLGCQHGFALNYVMSEYPAVPVLLLYPRYLSLYQSEVESYLLVGEWLKRE